MGFLVFLLIVTLVVVSYLWLNERSERDQLLAEHGQRLLDEHQNLREGLEELHDAEARAIAEMRTATRQSNGA